MLVLYQSCQVFVIVKSHTKYRKHKEQAKSHLVTVVLEIKSNASTQSQIMSKKPHFSNVALNKARFATP